MGWANQTWPWPVAPRPNRSEASAVLVRRGSCPGRVHASFLVPYCTLASCGGGAHYWARRDNA